MIVTDDMVSEAVQWLASSDQLAENVSLARRAADHALDEAKSRAFLESVGTVAERNAMSIVSEQYLEAAQVDSLAEARWQKFTHKRDYAKTIVDIWRTQNANQRAAESVR